MENRYWLWVLVFGFIGIALWMVTFFIGRRAHENKYARKRYGIALVLDAAYVQAAYWLLFVRSVHAGLIAAFPWVFVAIINILISLYALKDPWSSHKASAKWQESLTILAMQGVLAVAILFRA